MWTFKPFRFGQSPLRHDPDRHRPHQLLHLRSHLRRAGAHPLDWLPGGDARRWERLKAAVEVYGDIDAKVGVHRYEQGLEIRRFTRFQRAALVVAETGDHARYEACLRLFDSELPFPGPAATAFVGRGGGLDSVPVFRRLGRGGSARFEKIYLHERPSYDRAMMAQKAVLRRYPVVAVPELLEEARGKRLVAVHSTMIRVRGYGTLNAGAGIVRALAGIPLDAIPEAEPYRGRYWLAVARTLLLARLKARDTGLAERVEAALPVWEKQICARPWVFGHGDLNRSNFDASGMVWDWDNAGLLPYGVDAAYFAREYRFGSLDALLAFCAAQIERPGSAVQDRFAFAFFFLHFLLEPPGKPVNDPLFMPLVQAMPDLARDAV